MILTDLAQEIGISARTLSRKFDKLQTSKRQIKPSIKSLNLVLDAVYFGRNYGFFVFSADKKIIHFCEIKTENQFELEKALKTIEKQGFLFASFTLDGRKGLISFLRENYPDVPIQLCIFHQKAIISRYITRNPRTEIGCEIKNLTMNLQNLNQQKLLEKLDFLWKKHADFLSEKNETNKFKHSRCRSALKSLKNNAHLLFEWQKNPKIPSTTNCLEGKFSHVKEKVKIHRGLKLERRKKMIVSALEKYMFSRDADLKK